VTAHRPPANLTTAMRTRLIALATFSALLLACGMPRKVDVLLYEPQSWFGWDFPALPANAPVEIWVGETSRPKQLLAIISSSRTAERSRESREAQLEELRVRAREMGAHAIENIRVETAEVNGVVADPRVPFTAFKQGEFDLYFFRGTAVRYLDAPPGGANLPESH